VDAASRGQTLKKDCIVAGRNGIRATRKVWKTRVGKKGTRSAKTGPEVAPQIVGLKKTLLRNQLRAAKSGTTKTKVKKPERQKPGTYARGRVHEVREKKEPGLATGR